MSAAPAAAPLPFLGHGVGLRVPHYPRALEGRLDVDWVEVISENFFGGGGRPRAVLERVRRDLPLVLHGVSLGVGSPGPPLAGYLRQLRELADACQPAWVSDHLCWGHADGLFSHDLLPLPYTEEALAHVVDNVQRVQDALRRPILLENVSSYVGFSTSQLPEWEFLSEVAERSGCLLLLDLNNILVSAHNHGFSPEQYLAGLPAARIQQLHLANHSQLPTHKFDDHRGPVPEAVWQLFEAAWRRFGPISSLVEWDEDVPEWEELRAQQREAAARAGRSSAAASEQGREARSLVAAARAPAAPTVAAPAATLLDLQRLFFDALRHPTGVAHWLAEGGAERHQQLAATFVASPGFSVVERLDVYANSYFYRLLAALRELFPRLCWLCGAAPFHNLVTDYVLSCPSREPDLRRLGERLPAFLREHELARRHPLLADVAQLEQALNMALDAPEGTPLGEADLLAIPPGHWPELRFALSPPTSCVVSHWELERLEALYGAGQREAACGGGQREAACGGGQREAACGGGQRESLYGAGQPEAACGAGQRESLYGAGQREAALALAPESEPCVLLVGRRGHATYFRRLPAAEGRVLCALACGESFGEACAALEREHVAIEPGELVLAMGRWLAAGLLVWRR